MGWSGGRGTQFRDKGRPLHLRLCTLLCLGQRTIESAPDQHRDARSHRLVRSQLPRRWPLDLDQRVAGQLELSVERLTSGNQLYDRELRRRIDAKRYPIIRGQVTHVVANGAHPYYLVVGDVSFHGKTRSFEHEMQITCADESVELSGDYVFDIREFGMKPPSMLMVRVYPEISVRVEIHGTRAD